MVLPHQFRERAGIAVAALGASDTFAVRNKPARKPLAGVIHDLCALAKGVKAVDAEIEQRPRVVVGRGFSVANVIHQALTAFPTDEALAGPVRMGCRMPRTMVRIGFADSGPTGPVYSTSIGPTFSRLACWLGVKSGSSEPGLDSSRSAAS